MSDQDHGEAQARQKAADLQRAHDEAGQKSEQALIASRNWNTPKRSGTWGFSRVESDDGLKRLLCWRVEFDGKITALLVRREAALSVLSSSTDFDQEAHTAEEIIVAFQAVVSAGLPQE